MRAGRRCGVEMLREVFDNHWKQHKDERAPAYQVRKTLVQNPNLLHAASGLTALSHKAQAQSAGWLGSPLVRAADPDDDCPAKP